MIDQRHGPAGQRRRASSPRLLTVNPGSWLPPAGPIAVHRSDRPISTAPLPLFSEHETQMLKGRDIEGNRRTTGRKALNNQKILGLSSGGAFPRRAERGTRSIPMRPRRGPDTGSWAADRDLKRRRGACERHSFRKTTAGKQKAGDASIVCRRSSVVCLVVGWEGD